MSVLVISMEGAKERNGGHIAIRLSQSHSWDRLTALFLGKEVMRLWAYMSERRVACPCLLPTFCWLLTWKGQDTQLRQLSLCHVKEREAPSCVKCISPVNILAPANTPDPRCPCRPRTITTKEYARTKMEFSLKDLRPPSRTGSRRNTEIHKRSKPQPPFNGALRQINRVGISRKAWNSTPFEDA